jgi:serine phosphatase RsbU (regulator of sigma subunit)/HAMP domain-containing protein
MKLSLRKKLILGFMSIGLFISISFSFFMYKSSYQLFFNNFKKHKLSLLNFCSSFIDGDIHSKFIDSASIQTREFKNYHRILNSFLAKENKEEYIYLYTLNYNPIQKKYFYALDSTITPRDTVWVESELFSFSIYTDEKKVTFNYDFLYADNEFEIQNNLSKKYKLESIKKDNYYTILLNQIELVQIFYTNNKVTVKVDSNTILDNITHVNKIVKVDDKTIQFKISMTLKNDPGSIPGAEFIDNPNLIKRLDELLNSDLEYGITDEIYYSTYGNFMIGYSVIKNNKNEKKGIVIMEINKMQVDEFKKKMGLLATIISLVAFLIVLLFSYFVSQYITRPIEILSKAVENIAAGNLEPIHSINTQDEFQSLAINFNHMVDNLKIAYEVQYNLINEISEFNENLEKKVDARTKELNTKSIEIEKQLRLASKIQLSLLPDDIPIINGAKISFKFQPMMGVGGDLIDFDISPENELSIFICDVSGHGVPAAFLATMVKMSLQECYELGYSPRESILKIKRSLHGKLSGHFISAIFAKINLNTGEMIYSNAGHLPLILISKNGKYSQELAKGRVISETIQCNLEEKSINLSRGDKIILYTDGITEAKNSSRELFGEERLFNVIEQNFNQAPKQLCNSIYESVTTFSGLRESLFEDDISILITEFIGSNTDYKI